MGKVAEDLTENPAGLPAGCDGASWEALEAAIVRQERDVKSSKKGVVQAGEECFQTGPWRADPTGRVRMPIRGARGLFGWVTLDETRCKLATGEFGGSYFKLLQEEAKEEKKDEKATQKKHAQKSLGADIDDLLDMYGDEPSEDQMTSPVDSGNKYVSAAERLERKREVQKKARAEKEVQEVPAEEARAEEEVQEVPAEADMREAHVDEKAANVLTETEKALRSCRKKIRELEALETKAKAGGIECLQQAQQEKLAQLPGLRSKMKALAKAAAGDAEGPGGGAGAKKRRKKPGKAASTASAAAASSGSTRGPWVAILVVIVSAVAAWYLYQ